MTTTTQSDLAIRTPRVDVFESAREWLVVADVPGVPRDALCVELVGDVLVLSGTVPPLGEGPDGLSPLRFERKIRLAPSVDPHAVRAEHSDGVVRVVVGLAVATRKIAIA